MCTNDGVPALLELISQERQTYVNLALAQLQPGEVL